jgi:hypothetical protein
MQTYLRAECLVHRVQFITAYWKFSPDFAAVGNRLVLLADLDGPPDLLNFIKCMTTDFVITPKTFQPLPIIIIEFTG